MEQLHNGFTLELCEGAFPLSTDSVALADFVRLPKNARVLDLGSGCGTLGLLLCAKDNGCCVTGLEISEDAHAMALHNRDANSLQGRLDSICADVNQFSSTIAPSSFQCVISNPPYFTGGPQSATLSTARREDLLSAQILFQAAAWALQYGKDFYLVHRPERLAELFHLGCSNHLEPKRLCLLRHREDGPVSLVLIQFRKGAKPGLKWESLCLYDRNGNPTQDYRKLYHL